MHDVYQNECQAYEKGRYQTKPLIECFQASDDRHDPEPIELINSEWHVGLKLLRIRVSHVHYGRVCLRTPIDKNINTSLLELECETGDHGLNDLVRLHFLV